MIGRAIPLPVLGASGEPTALQVDAQRIERSCGACSLCCDVMAVHEIAKPRNVKCTQLTPMGRCRIYGKHPESCQVFKCLWKRGMLPDHLSPLRTHAIGDVNADGNILVLHISPRDRGAHRRGALAAWLAGVVKQNKLTVVVICGEERTVMGKDADRVVSMGVQDVSAEDGTLVDRVWTWGIETEQTAGSQGHE